MSPRIRVTPCSTPAAARFRSEQVKASGSLSSPTIEPAGPTARRSASRVPEPHPRLRNRSSFEWPGSFAMTWATVAFRASGRLHTRQVRAESGIGVNLMRTSQPAPLVERRMDKFKWALSVSSSSRSAVPISLRIRLIVVDSAPAALTRNVLNVPAGWKPIISRIAPSSRRKCSWPKRAFGRGASNRSTRCTAMTLRNFSILATRPEYRIEIRPSRGYPVSRYSLLPSVSASSSLTSRSSPVISSTSNFRPFWEVVLR